jgi:hypothetical protein
MKIEDCEIIGTNMLRVTKKFLFYTYKVDYIYNGAYWVESDGSWVLRNQDVLDAYYKELKRRGNINKLNR